jgi:hypothetical protein
MGRGKGERWEERIKKKKRKEGRKEEGFSLQFKIRIMTFENEAKLVSKAPYNRTEEFH